MKVLYTILLIVGFLLLTSESEYFIINFIGLAVFCTVGYKLNLFEYE